MHNFDVIARIDVPDYSSQGIYLRHRKTGFEVFHLLNQDEENLFAFAFRTPPADSTGAPHILEHSVLCGSQKYPLKDPFIRLANQSVKTFLNAMTFPDKTVYPASSMVEADYFNLMSVYGDAVFFPLLEKWTFAQEAHRLEFDSEGKLTIQGVVYNEMKGNYSSFDSIAADASLRSLLPGTVYDADSGGDPLEIPRLTWEQFRKFHQQYYHPGNGLLFLYGNIPTDKQLAFVEERFLCRFPEGRPAIPVIGDVKPFLRPLVIERPGPAQEGPDAASGCTVTLNWLTGVSAVSYMELVFLSEVLMGHDGSPLTRALVESGLGEDMAPNCGVELDIKYSLLTAGLRGVRRENAPKVEACILETLERLCRDPVNSADIEAAVMSVDFSNREVRRVHGPYSLVLARRILRSWVYGGDPWACLSPRSAFAPIKAALASDPHYVAALIQRLLLHNLHRSLVTVYPDPDYNGRQVKAEANLIAELAAQTKGTDFRAQQAELTAFQQREEDKTAAATLPHIKPASLTVKIDRIETSVETGPKGVPLFKNREPVNGITYIEVGFPVDVLAPADYPLLPFFSTALANSGFGGKSWAECAQNIAVNAGGFGATLFTSSVPESSLTWENRQNPAIGRDWFFLQIKMLSEKTGRALELLGDCLLTADFSNPKRLKDLALENRNDLKASVLPHGNEYAASRSSSALSKSKAIDEIWNGLSQLFTMQGLAESDMTRLGVELNRLRKILISSGSVIHLTADDEGFALAEKPIAALIERCGLHAPALPAVRGLADYTAFTALPWRKTLAGSGVILPELCLVPSAQVGFAARTFPASPCNTVESAHEGVFGHWLSNTLLWEQIRTIGGAYGAFALPDNLEQVFSLITYRDPRPLQSLESFTACLQKAAAMKFDAETVERAITGAYSQEVQPRAPSSRGFTGFIRKLYGVTQEQREAKIAALLAVTPQDMHNTAERLLALCKADNPSAVIAGTDTGFAGRIVDIP
ncbi:MAG: insulinase family protein [Treponema sp.]|jgi:Zn-dependent M16 (insulinase) family peptidase|nr:insulinase family protein [Treponema sp.]